METETEITSETRKLVMITPPKNCWKGSLSCMAFACCFNCCQSFPDVEEIIYTNQGEGESSVKIKLKNNGLVLRDKHGKPLARHC